MPAVFSFGGLAIGLFIVACTSSPRQDVEDVVREFYFATRALANLSHSPSFLAPTIEMPSFRNMLASVIAVWVAAAFPEPAHRVSLKEINRTEWRRHLVNCSAMVRKMSVDFCASTPSSVSCADLALGGSDSPETGIVQSILRILEFWPDDKRYRQIGRLKLAVNETCNRHMHDLVSASKQALNNYSFPVDSNRSCSKLLGDVKLELLRFALIDNAIYVCRALETNGFVRSENKVLFSTDTNSVGFDKMVTAARKSVDDCLSMGADFFCNLKGEHHTVSREPHFSVTHQPSYTVTPESSRYNVTPQPSQGCSEGPAEDITAAEIARCRLAQNVDEAEVACAALVPSRASLAGIGHFGGIVPSGYSINLSIDVARKSFAGSVQMTFTATQSTRVLVLNSCNLTISVPIKPTESRLLENGVTLQWLATNKAGTAELFPMTVQSTHEIKTLQVLLIVSSKPTTPGESYRLAISDYSGRINRPPETIGLFESAKAFATQFQMEYARSVFPCIDHPKFKAVFRITIAVEEGFRFRVLSNMPIKRQFSEGDSKTVAEFLETPVMSTYLAAIALVPVSWNQRNKAFANLNVRFHVEPHSLRGPAVTRMLDVVHKSWAEMTRLFDIVPPVSKLDFVILPEFRILGMENWGLVTIRSGLSAKQTDDTIMHEVAHHWIGNLATISDWNEFCLQEGLTDYYEQRLGKVYRGEFSKIPEPGPKFQEDFETALEQVNSLVHDIRNVEDTRQFKCYDTAPFELLEAALGTDNFDRGWRQLVKQYAYGNLNSSIIASHFRKIQRQEGGV